MLPTDEPHFYDDLFLMRFVMTHSKGGKECNLKVRINVCVDARARAPRSASPQAVRWAVAAGPHAPRLTARML